MPTAKREDHALIKWILGIVASIAVLFVIEFFSGIKAEARLIEQVKANTQGIQELKDFKLKLIRIEVMTEMVVNKINEVAGTVKMTRSEQVTRTPDINNIRNHLKGHK